MVIETFVVALRVGPLRSAHGRVGPTIISYFPPFDQVRGMMASGNLKKSCCA